MKTVIIIQARMTSTRLPGKILKTVLGKSLLEYQIERLQRVKSADQIVIATTTNDTDQPVIDFCNYLNIPCFRGAEEDVLARYHDAATEYHAETIVRITSDCPVIDPGVVDQVIQFYLYHYPNYDYATNCLERTYPRGMDVEVFSFTALNEAFLEAVDQPEREHVTPFIYRRPERYRIWNVRYPVDNSKYRWTVDTPEDFELIKRIIEALYPKKTDFTLEDILELFIVHKDWFDINSFIEQKKLGL